jgi:Cof subfamily protein (haloacid dehalogenase superfamily)
MDIKEKLKKLKLVVLDLDGTLLSDDGNVGDRTKSLIKELKKLGVNFSFATGRLHSAITALAEELNVKTPLISLDGSLIKSFPDNKVLYEYSLKKKHVLKAISFSEKCLLNIALCHGDAIYYTEQNSVIPRIMDKFGARYEEIPGYNGYIENTLEVVFASDNKDAIKYIQGRMDIPYMFGVNNSYFKSQRNAGIYYLEVRRKGANKKTGVYHLLKFFKLKIDQTAVIGDWYNDLALFQTDALKVALANAVPEIKRYADIELSKNNNEDGTGEFLEMVLKAKVGK